jgi:hypothetical protein
VEGAGYLGCDDVPNVSAVARCSAGAAAERVTECRAEGRPCPVRVVDWRGGRSSGSGGVDGGTSDGGANWQGRAARGLSRLFDSGTARGSASRKGGKHARARHELGKSGRAADYAQSAGVTLDLLQHTIKPCDSDVWVV